MIEEITMPNFSWIVHGRVEEEKWRAFRLLMDIANKVNSEISFVLVPSEEYSGFWTIPEGWFYSEREFPSNLSISSDEELIRKVLLDESIVLDPELGDKIPESFSQVGIRSLIAVALGFPKREALLVVCNSKEPSGKPPYQVSYTRGDDELAKVMARVISMDGVGKFIHKRIIQGEPIVKNTESKNIWEKEKKELLKTHKGWFVAYQEGTRVALEPSIEKLISSLEQKFGTPRKPCVYHEITEQPIVRRGPSPRLMPAKTER